ncbi:MAG: hypothetical protein CM15mP54_01130 [Paracoccaceae bacterium]|nr:MAG: hypothetical protein CM15mP54_01130 [Paracoccaceae bacterium]
MRFSSRWHSRFGFRDEPEAEADNFKVERNFFRYSLMYLFLQFGSILVDLGLGTNFSWGSYEFWG